MCERVRVCESECGREWVWERVSVGERERESRERE